MIVIIMGVTGTGKTTVGELLAKRLNLTFADADDYHPPANKAKMAAGHPLDDNDRQAWLETLNHLLQGWFHAGTGAILACSALKEKYRTTLEAGMPAETITFCLLDGSKELIASRLAARHHEYMNPKLLDSQIATLEMPSESEAFRFSIAQTPDQIVDQIINDLTSVHAAAHPASEPPQSPTPVAPPAPPETVSSRPERSEVERPASPDAATSEARSPGSLESQDTTTTGDKQ